MIPMQSGTTCQCFVMVLIGTTRLMERTMSTATLLISSSVSCLTLRSGLICSQGTIFVIISDVSSGAKYVVLTSKHHDGYCLWPTESPFKANWNSMTTGPMRDIVGEVSAAVRERGLRMGLYYSVIEWETNISARAGTPTGMLVYDGDGDDSRSLVTIAADTEVWINTESF